MLAAFPILWFSQQPEAVQEAIESTGWPLSVTIPLFLWPIGVFTALLITCFLILSPLRKKGNRTAKILTVVLPIIGWSIWHFYPSFTFRGTYERQWLGETQYVIIEDKYVSGDLSADYNLKPIHRMIFVEMNSPLLPEGYPIKLGWNKIYEWNFKSGGWDKLKRAKEK